MKRRGQSLVECAVCLPFLLLLLGATAEFGRYLYYRHALWGVARDAALALTQAPDPPDAAALSGLLRRVLATGRGQDLRLDAIQIRFDSPGFYRVEVRRPYRPVVPAPWLGDAVTVTLVVPVEGA